MECPDEDEPCIASSCDWPLQRVRSPPPPPHASAVILTYTAINGSTRKGSHVDSLPHGRSRNGRPHHRHHPGTAHASQKQFHVGPLSLPLLVGEWVHADVRVCVQVCYDDGGCSGCRGNPCYMGTCTEGVAGSFTCSCVDGWTGAAPAVSAGLFCKEAPACYDGSDGHEGASPEAEACVPMRQCMAPLYMNATALASS